jgi:hypothetical protein
MTASHIMYRYANFKRFVRGLVVKEIINLIDKEIQILELIDLKGIMRSR